MSFSETKQELAVIDLSCKTSSTINENLVEGVRSKSKLELGPIPVKLVVFLG